MSESLPSDDRGLLLGDGLFETVLFKAGRPVLWPEHVGRLARGCAVIGLAEPDPAQLIDAAGAALSAAGLDQARAAVRLSWTAGSGGRGLERPSAAQPCLIVTAAPSPPAAAPAALAMSVIRRNETSATSRLKTMSYLDNVLARREARAQGADEALMLNSRGEIAGCAAANLFFIRDNCLFTPSLECGVLDGITRAQVLRMARSAGLTPIETRADRQTLESAEAVFITNSLVGIRPVNSLDGRAFGHDPRVGALARALSEVG